MDKARKSLREKAAALSLAVDTLRATISNAEHGEESWVTAYAGAKVVVRKLLGQVQAACAARVRKEEATRRAACPHLTARLKPIRHREHVPVLWACLDCGERINEARANEEGRLIIDPGPKLAPSVHARGGLPQIEADHG